VSTWADLQVEVDDLARQHLLRERLARDNRTSQRVIDALNERMQGMSLLDMTTETVDKLSDEHLENSLRNTITSMLEGVSFSPSGTQGSDGQNLHQFYERGHRTITVAVSVDSR
jgi:hypothetical protein